MVFERPTLLCHECFAIDKSDLMITLIYSKKLIASLQIQKEKEMAINPVSMYRVLLRS
jgi:hypothetical protein